MRFTQYDFGPFWNPTMSFFNENHTCKTQFEPEKIIQVHIWKSGNLWRYWLPCIMNCKVNYLLFRAIVWLAKMKPTKHKYFNCMCCIFLYVLGGRGVEPLTKFSKMEGMGLDRTFSFKGGLVRKKKVIFLRGVGEGGL